MKQAEMDTIEEIYGCKFIDVGRTPPAKYLQPVPKPAAPRRDSGTVVRIIPGGSSSVALVKCKKDEFHAVIDAGAPLPAMGSAVEIEIVSGVARIRRGK